MHEVAIRELLAELAERAVAYGPMEIVLVGGAAGLLTGLLPPTRTTLDRDVIRTDPPGVFAELERIAGEIAEERGLSSEWLSARVMQLDVLPAGWRGRRIHVGDFFSLKVWAVGRRDLLAMKVYAGRIQDRADVLDMKPTREELSFIRRYLDQLRIPSRQANLDQVQSALRFVAALGGEG